MASSAQALDGRAFASNAALTITILLWGSQFAAVAELLEVWGAFEVAVFRFLAPVPIFIAALAWERMAVPREPPIVVPMRLWLLGPLGVATFNLCFTFGVLYAGSVGAAVAASISPLVAVFVLWLGFRVQPGRGIAVAVALAVVGGLIAALGNPVARQGGVHGLGEAIMILGSAVWTWYSHLAQSWLRGWSQLRIAAITLIPAALFLLILYVGAVVGGALAFPPATPSYWQLAMLAYLAMFPTFTGIMAWNYGVKNLGVTVATLYLNFIPVVAVVIAAIAGTWPNWEQLLGGAMMLVGVIHAQRKRADVRD